MAATSGGCLPVNNRERSETVLTETRQQCFHRAMTNTKPIRPSECLSLVLSVVALNEDEASAILTAKRHRPDPKRTGSHWRVDCSCGWKGPQVSLPGHGHQPWAAHFEAVR